MECHAFTLKETSVVNRLKTPVQIFDKYIAQDLDKEKQWTAIWDTGATATCITANVASELNLIPAGTATTSTAGGDTECNTYCIDILLPNKVLVQNLTVFEVQLSDGDVLIGMDLIKLGDFTITNYNGQTKLTFRIPSIESVDYVEIINKSQNV